MPNRLTIGELAVRTGVPVKTLRFYSDEGLLPPSGRSQSGYRLYSEEQVARVLQVRALRDAGIDLASIAKVLRRKLPLEDVLHLRLGAIEAEVAALKRVACALRVALREHATEEDLRRISMVTKLSNAERKNVVANFYRRVMEGSPDGDAFAQGMVDATVPDLPDDASAEQLDAWVELAALLEDETFLASMRTQAKNSWSSEVDQTAMRTAQGAAASAAKAARSHGIPPTSDEGRAIAIQFFADIRKAGGNPHHDTRADRYWELVAIMKGQGARTSDGYEDWRWVGAALEHHRIA